MDILLRDKVERKADLITLAMMAAENFGTGNKATHKQASALLAGYQKNTGIVEVALDAARLAELFSARIKVTQLYSEKVPDIRQTFSAAQKILKAYPGLKKTYPVEANGLEIGLSAAQKELDDLEKTVDVQILTSAKSKLTILRGVADRLGLTLKV